LRFAIEADSSILSADNGDSSMRDIRPDLRERLTAVIERLGDETAEFERKQTALQQDYKRRLDALGRERAALEQLLMAESERAGNAPPTLAQKLITLVPLGDFLVAKVQAHGPMEKDQLRSEAKLAGYFADGDGRTFHITLMNIKNGGRIVQLPDGRYASGLFEVGQPNQWQEEQLQTRM
jgi:hypothetical protein